MSYSSDVVIIGVTGLPSSGKGEFTAIAEDMGFQKVIMGDVIRNEVQTRGLELTRENANIVMLDLREKHGTSVVANTILEWVQGHLNNHVNKIVIDGLRSMSEVDQIRKRFPEIQIIAIHASPKIRYQRAQSRRRIDDASSRDSFIERDRIELGVGIGDVIALSDVLIDSSEDLSRTQDKYRTVIKELMLNSGQGDVDE